MVDGILTREERDLALKCMEKALAKGAEKVRVTAYKSVMDLVGTLNGEVDKVKHNLDRFLSICMVVANKIIPQAQISIYKPLYFFPLTISGAA